MKHVDPMGGGGGAGYLRGMHINWGFLSGGLQFGGVISGGYSPGVILRASISTVNDSLTVFKSRLKTELFNQAFIEH